MWTPTQFVSMFVHGPMLHILINPHPLTDRTVTLEKKQVEEKTLEVVKK